MAMADGIHFDGILNDKELAHIKLWLDRNRNLMVETKDVEFINALESIINENDEDRLYVLIEKTKEQLEFRDDEVELNGIIDGIICDDDINIKELSVLKQWMEAHDELLDHSKDTKDLYHQIGQILQNNMLTKEEHEVLSDRLTRIIGKSELDMKLERICKRVREKKNIGLSLIEFLNDDLAMAEIHKKAQYQMNVALSSKCYDNCKNPEIVIVSLSLIGMIHYDGNFYEHVEKIYSKLYENPSYSSQNIQGAIRDFLRKFQTKSNSNSNERLIGLALSHAIVPQHYLSAFFDFIYDIYKINFDYDLSDELYEDFKFVFEGLRSKMLSDGDEISINVTQKTYKLIVTTKDLIIRESDLDALIRFSIIIVKLIDKRIWNKDKVQIVNPYLKQGYLLWERQLEKQELSRISDRSHVKDFRSRWEPKIVVEDNEIYLVPPIHRVKEQYDYRSLVIVVMNGEEEIYREERPDVREIIGGYQLNLKPIRIDKPLGELSYRLLSNDETIYDSKKKLHRDYIIFDSNGHELANNTDYSGAIYICCDLEETEFERLAKNSYYSLCCKFIKNGDLININGNIIHFESLTKPGICGTLNKNCFVKIEDEKKLWVYKELRYLVFQVESSKEKFEILINDKAYKISDMRYQKEEIDGKVKYYIDFNLDVNGLYNVRVNHIKDGKKEKVFAEEFVYDSILEFNCKHFEDDWYNLRVKSALLEEDLNLDITAEDYSIELIPFEYRGRECFYILPLDTGYYQIDESVWKAENDDLWIEDISTTTKIKILDSNCNGLLVYKPDGSLLEDDILVKNADYYSEVSINFLRSYRKNYSYVKLVFTADGRPLHTYHCYNKSVFDQERTQIDYLDEPKMIKVTPIFHGKNPVFFEVFNEDGKIVHKSKTLNSGETESFEDFHSFENYTFRFHEKTKELLLRENSLIAMLQKKFPKLQ